MGNIDSIMYIIYLYFIVLLNEVRVQPITRRGIFQIRVFKNLETKKFSRGLEVWIRSEKSVLCVQVINFIWPTEGGTQPLIAIFTYHIN